MTLKTPINEQIAVMYLVKIKNPYHLKVIANDYEMRSHIIGKNNSKSHI